MHDIFLSYATEDRERLTPLVAAFRQQGWTVFWDHQSIGGGDDWSDEIETAAYESLCMVVVWSQLSLETTVHGAHTRYAIRSKWIRKEAKIAEKRAVLIPIRLDDIPPPDLFDEYQVIDFKDWSQQSNHASFTNLSQQIQIHLTRHANALRQQALDKLAEELTLQREVLTQRKQELDRQQAKWDTDDQALRQQEDELAHQQSVLNALLHTPTLPLKPIVKPTPINVVVQIPQPTLIQPVARQPFEPEMVSIPAGSFTMGWVKERDGNGYDSENPAHTVNLKCFEIGKYPVTQAQWQAVMGGNPSHFKGDACPVEQVSWDDVQTFIHKLNVLTGSNYRLPSEAEWEYACRAGENHLHSGSDDVRSVAWYDGNSDKKTHPVGEKQANAWGLHDMSGNVWEWVQDPWHKDYQGAPTDGSVWGKGGDNDARVLRGGSWGDNPLLVRAAYRSRVVAANRDDGAGFRLARTLP